MFPVVSLVLLGWDVICLRGVWGIWGGGALPDKTVLKRSLVGTERVPVFQ